MTDMPDENATAAMPPIDSLDLARRLEAMGLPKAPAEEIASYLRAAAHIIGSDPARGSADAGLSQRIVEELAPGQQLMNDELLLQRNRLERLQLIHIRQGRYNRDTQLLLRWICILLGIIAISVGGLLAFEVLASGLIW